MSEVERIATFRAIVFSYNILMTVLYLCQKENVPLNTLTSGVYLFILLGRQRTQVVNWHFSQLS